MNLADLPIFAVCGHSGSGKTTLLEALLARAEAEAESHGSHVTVPRDAPTQGDARQ